MIKSTDNREIKNDRWVSILVTTLTIVGTLAFLIFSIKAYQGGYLTDEQKMADFVNQFGPLAPVTFWLLQLVQTIIPLIPGGISVPAAAIIFGKWGGFLINVSSILPGSIFNFWIGRKYGWRAIKKVTTEEQTETARKWLDRVNNSKFGITKSIAISMFVPGFPADLLCYIYGLTNIRKRNMLIILIIAKPINLFVYAWIVTEPLKALLSI